MNNEAIKIKKKQSNTFNINKIMKTKRLQQGSKRPFSNIKYYFELDLPLLPHKTKLYSPLMVKKTSNGGCQIPEIES